MQHKARLVFAAFLLPLVVGWAVASAADEGNAGGFRLVLTDGSIVSGALSFVINLDTAYGRITLTPGNLVSVRFDAEQKWVDVQLTDAHLRLKYNPSSSDLKAATSAGPLSIALPNVIRVAKASAEAPGATSPQVAQSPSAPASQAAAPPPVVTYPPQQPAAAPPTVVYQYPYPYAPPANYYSYSPYYYSPYYYSPYYWPGPYIGWPYFGLRIGVGPRFFGGLRWGFGLRIR